MVPDYASLHPGYKARLPPELTLVRCIIRLIDGELVHRGRPQMLGKAWRCEIDLALGDALGKCTVQLGHRTLHPEQREYPAVKAMASSQDYVEGPKAFSEKRPPKWLGR